MNILVSTDAHYQHITETLLFSFAENNPSHTLHVWCMHSRLTEKEKRTFQLYLQNRCGVHDINFVDMSWMKNIEDSLPLYIKHISIETYYRLFAHFVLPKNLNRILWLDSDIIVRGKLDELYNQDLEDVSLVAFPNMGDSAVGGNAERLGLPRNYTYFNAGVLLLNLDFLRHSSPKEQLMTFFAQYGASFKQQDQDALNLLYYKTARVIDDHRYNFMVNALPLCSSSDLAEKALLVHYAGWQKPWRIKWQNEYSCYWWNVKRKEGLSYKDYLILYIGYLWKVLRLNTLEKWVLSPYYWLQARIKTDDKRHYPHME